MRRSVTVLALLGVGLAVGTAVADTQASYPTRVTIGDDNTKAGAAAKHHNFIFHFKGKVISRLARCEKSRTVKLIDRNADNNDPNPPMVVGTTTSDGHGRWSIEMTGKPQADVYVAKALGRSLGGGRTCKSGHSRKYFYIPF